MGARFPFSAVVGHDDLRLALLLNAVHPGVGGVLVRGEKGTAKSTVVRALAALLPDLAVVPGCRFGCEPGVDADCPDGPHAGGPHAAGAPGTGPAAEHRPARLVELPVGATEDRLIGSLDLERALTEGVRAYQPGLLAAAHRGVLYVDEVNLLQDHLVDLLLDAAAMGRAHVEREGVSVSHPASFLLVGTMNPEEGELRPQLLDRFGLTVAVKAARDVPTRAEVIRRRLAYEADPAGFARAWESEDAALAARIARARAALPSVALPDAELRRIAGICAAFEVDGMRADLVVARAATAHAAWRGAEAVQEQDVEAAVRLALPHRKRRDPFDEPGMEEEQLSEAMRQGAEHAQDETDDTDGPDDDPDGPGDGGPDDGGQGPDQPQGPQEPGGEQPEPSNQDGRPNGSGGTRAHTPSPAFRTRLLQVPGVGEGASGKRSRARSRSGRAVRPSTTEGSGLHLVATLAAAAPHQATRGRTGPGLLLRGEDLRKAVREGTEGNLVLFVVDASGSMAARQRMSAVSGAVISLLRDAYQRRDKVGVITFRGSEAETALPPTTSVDAAAARLRALRTGGRTPLADGLLRARRVLQSEKVRDPRRRPLLVLLTDGRATATGAGGDPVRDALRAAGLLAADRVASVVVDCESGHVRLGMAARVAAALDGACLRLEELSADQVAGVVRAARAA
ncbi:putative cobaltochelatase [Actinosynnema mirum]|uniref:Mg-protoporphyrin IX chelatase n=1 Tax=Actinosynnema mirum (strain ATCC 29888 / DSM 43827 / JCM 3225 / NBRC 14064 / NCIMB 13271 / NRRL B-12336 / IMRU 3971 / 101) TaxID=446462 RepID=C6WEP5_ACTMD|nr:putative cobaltochelatase [Actinosynnema mirum]ACU39670.1 Magnesium chelatase [Actinosynnema mirum DSM 43827]